MLGLKNKQSLFFKAKLFKMISKQNLLYITFAISLSSILGSLYFSEVRHFVPCILCWYQRVAMYPLFVIILVGILRKDTKNIPYYVLPLSTLGLLVSFYQNLLYFNFLSEANSICAQGASCTARFIQILGLDIPQFSFISFLLITISMLSYLRR